MGHIKGHRKSSLPDKHFEAVHVHIEAAFISLLDPGLFALCNKDVYLEFI